MATLDFWGIVNLIKAEFPQYVNILTKPGVFDVFVRYATAKSSGVNPWTSDQLLAEYHKTPYYQQSNDAERQWDLLQATDPATANTRIEQVARTINDLEVELGFYLDENGGMASQGFQFMVDAVRNNWDANEIRYRMISAVHPDRAYGQIGSFAAQAKKMSNDYGVPMSDENAIHWGRRLAMGQVDENGMRGYLIEAAKSLFPSLGDYLDKGGTVMDYVAPYIQIAQQETGLNPADVNLTDSKWMNILNQIDPKTGNRVAMSLDQALRTIRTDAAWGYDSSSSGMASATNLASQLQTKFGAAA